jgi:hypothetical protein
MQWEELAMILRNRFGVVKLIAIEGGERLRVAKTDNINASLIRSSCADPTLGNGRFRTILTSGSLGKLKSLAKEAAPSRFGQIPQ